MIIILMGAPGSGKGSQAAILSRSYNVPHISTGDILRKEVADGTDIGLVVKDIMAKGAFPKDDLIISMLQKRLAEEDCQNGFVLDGFPRTMDQAIAFDSLLKQSARHLSAVVELHVDAEIILKRITGRYSCSTCGTIYNDYFKSTQVEGKCDHCDSKEFIRRTDDKEEVVQKRIDMYEQSTKEVLGFYRNKNLLYRVDASHQPEEVFDEIKVILSSESVY